MPVLERFRSASPRLILLAGFGGLLALVLTAGLYLDYDLASVQARNDAIRAHFIERNLLLNEIRGDVYLSGTYIRDYMLDADLERAPRDLAALESSRLTIHNNLQAYAKLVSNDTAKPIAGLTNELDRYWAALDPVMKWTAAERRERGNDFLRDLIYPRRTLMLSIADQIDRLNREQLSDGSRQVTKLFSDFRWSLTVSLFVTLCLGLVLAIYSIRGVLKLEKQASQRYAEVLDVQSQLKNLSARLVETQEEERRSIARELHDEVGQSLSALLVGLSNLWANVSSASGVHAFKEDFNAIRRLAEQSVNVVRNMSLLLRPSMLDDLGLVPALQWQARELSRRTGIRVDVVAEQVSDELPEAHMTCIYRLVQEALHNSSRHGSPQSIRIRVRQEADCLRLSIQDDGKGFSVQEQKGMGLIGMQERVANLGGLFEVDSAPGRGTLLSAALPLVSVGA